MGGACADNVLRYLAVLLDTFLCVVDTKEIPALLIETIENCVVINNGQKVQIPLQYVHSTTAKCLVACRQNRLYNSKQFL